MASVKVDIDKALKKLDVKSNQSLGLFAATEAKEGMRPYVPFRNGYLDASAQAAPWKVTYGTDHAVYAFYGDHMTFSRERHALACARWHEPYARANGQKLAAAIGRMMTK